MSEESGAATAGVGAYKVLVHRVFPVDDVNLKNTMQRYHGRIQRGSWSTGLVHDVSCDGRYVGIGAARSSNVLLRRSLSARYSTSNASSHGHIFVHSLSLSPYS